MLRTSKALSACPRGFSLVMVISETPCECPKVCEILKYCLGVLKASPKAASECFKGREAFKHCPSVCTALKLIKNKLFGALLIVTYLFLPALSGHAVISSHARRHVDNSPIVKAIRAFEYILVIRQVHRNTIISHDTCLLKVALCLLPYFLKVALLQKESIVHCIVTKKTNSKNMLQTRMQDLTMIDAKKSYNDITTKEYTS